MCCVGKLTMNIVWLKHPPVHMAAAFIGHDLERFPKEVRGDLHGVITVVRVNNEVKGPRFISSRYLAIPHDVVMAIVSCDESSKPGSSALAKVEPQVIIQWACTISSPRISNEVRDLIHAGGVHLTLDFE
jgi:hypothetical protein